MRLLNMYLDLRHTAWLLVPLACALNACDEGPGGPLGLGENNGGIAIGGTGGGTGAGILSFAVQPSSATAGNIITPPVQVTVRDSLGNVDTSFTAAITITLAAFHQPRFFSSDTPGWTRDGSVEPFWNRLYAANADLVLNGQQHQYERLAPMTPDGALDQVRGIRSINVGTGGESTALPVAIHSNSEAISDAFGVLKLTLYADRYTWEFVPLPGETFRDQGSGTCH